MILYDINILPWETYIDDILGVADLPGLAEDKGSRGCRGIGGWASPGMTSR